MKELLSQSCIPVSFSTGLLISLMHMLECPVTVKVYSCPQLRFRKEQLLSAASQVALTPVVLLARTVKF